MILVIGCASQNGCWEIVPTLFSEQHLSVSISTLVWVTRKDLKYPIHARPNGNHTLKLTRRWWTEVWNAQLRRGMETVTLTPEFGPPPYQHTLPYSQKPVSDLTDICDWMSVRQAVRFRDLLSRAEIGRSKRVSAPAKNRTQSRRLEPDAVGRGPKIQFEP